MKKYMIAALAALLVLSAAAFAENEGISLSVTVPNIYEGCGWEYACEDEGFISDPFVEEGTDEGGLSVLTYYFSVNGTGSTRVLLRCDNGDGISAPVATAICNVEADADGELYVRTALTDTAAGTLTVTLSGNGSVWTFAGDPNDVMVLTQETEIEDDSVFVLRADEAGTTYLSFVCAPMWDPNAAATEEYIVSVNVDSDKTISLILDNDDEDYDDYDDEGYIEETEGEDLNG